MSRHRGRSRPFTARRRIWPKHCGCKRPHGWAEGRSLVEFHAVSTAAPLIPPYLALSTWKLSLPLGKEIVGPR